MRFLASLVLLTFLLTSCTESPVQSSKEPITRPTITQSSPLDKMAQLRKNELWEHFRHCPSNEKALNPQQLIPCPTDIFVARIHKGEFVVTTPAEGVTIRLSPVDDSSKVRLDFVVEYAKLYVALLNIGPGADGKDVFISYDSRYWETGFSKVLPLEIFILVSHPGKTSYVGVSDNMHETLKSLKLWPYLD